MIKRFLPIVGLAAALSPSLSFAANSWNAMWMYDGMGYQASQRPDVDATIGLGFVSAPEYSGSGENEINFLPFIDIKAGDLFFNTYEGLGYNIYKDKTMRLAPVVSYDFGRKEDDSAKLRGMGDMDGGIELGVLSEVHLSDKFILDGHLKMGVEGFLADFGASYQDFLSADMMHRVRLGLTWMGDNHTEAYYGVDLAQSVASGYAPYSAGGGLNKYDVSYTFIWGLDENWGIAALADYALLGGEAADSPIVKAGADSQFTIGTSLLYRF